MNTTELLVIFDLDRTLLNKQSKLTEYTLQTLRAMDEQGIRYTIATGRGFVSASRIIGHHSFTLPQIYTNGVITWCPNQQQFSFENCLTVDEGLKAASAMKSDMSSPFISAIDNDNQKYIFYGNLRNKLEVAILKQFSQNKKANVLPIEGLTQGLHVTNVSMVGPAEDIVAAKQKLAKLDQFIVYSGQTMEYKDYHWIDVHHSLANKGAAVSRLKQQLGIQRVMCFGDGDNDLSMFHVADESYAPANAEEHIKQSATDVIGHHDSEGVATFLRQRFKL